MNKIPMIAISGKPYQRGYEYGKQAKAQIQLNIRNYQKLFQDRKNIDHDQALMITQTFQQAIDSYEHSYTEEMQGIAKGAEVDYEDILMINCRSELLFSDNEVTQACTAFSILPEANIEHKTYAGQTWDFAKMQREAMINLKISYEDNTKMIIFTEAGLIGGKGMNNYGIAMTLNALNTSKTCIGLPLHLRMRSVLEAKTLASAYQKAVNGLISCSATFILTHRDGLALGVELTPDDFDVILPNQGIITHTNHILSSRLKIKDNNRLTGSTFVRLCSINELIYHQPKINLSFLKQLLQDHRGYPNSICVHSDDTQPKMKQIATNQAIIMNLSDQIIYYTYGNPCENEFEIIDLNKEGFML